MESTEVLDALADALVPRILERLRVASAPTPADVFNATEWLTTNAAAQRWGLKPAYLENLRTKGGGPEFTKIGNIVRYNAIAGDLWMASRTRKSTAGKK
jgi:hypothetical protein